MRVLKSGHRGSTISGRTSISNATIEVNTAVKSSFIRQTTDFSTTLGGVAIDLTRTYDASTGEWTFGYEPRIQTNTGVGGRVSVVGCRVLGLCR
jgi:hypothetical protein